MANHTKKNHNTIKAKEAQEEEEECKIKEKEDSSHHIMEEVDQESMEEADSIIKIKDNTLTNNKGNNQDLEVEVM